MQFYLFDETEIQMSRKEIQNQKLICGIILVDNYEEALNSTEEVRRCPSVGTGRAKDHQVYAEL